MNNQTRELSERPQDYLGPNLNPTGLVLNPRELGPGVFALLANIPPKDNNGVIIGRDAALVIDAGINATVSHQIQDIVGNLTDRPLRYLVNTTYHGDHTFGNAAFPASVTIISSRANKDGMRDLDYEKQMRFGNMRGDENPLSAVTTWRTPDVVFDRYCAVDLGAKTVELWHFGPGNGPGDTIVFDRDTGTAWTGNFLMSAGLPPMLLEGGPVPYLESLRAMQQTLPVQVVVPGHGPAGDGAAALRNFIDYLQQLLDQVTAARATGWSAEETVARIATPDLLRVPATIHPTPEMQQLLGHLHRLNVLATYRDLEQQGR
ncbi:MBL fold metallo-hydrolase [Nocardia sp. NPDC046763]|uniref:MBL fold metallo-hydrolase n=1 Tax=Nocardia sp. NPDC046763 TaxID=3155256 RepID=UPI0033E21534